MKVEQQAGTPGAKPEVKSCRVIAESVEGGGILTMDHVGEVKLHATPAAVVRWVKRRDARLQADGGGIVVTQIEWRGMPAGFVPPDAGERP